MGDSYRLKHSKARQLAQDAGIAVDPDNGEISEV